MNSDQSLSCALFRFAFTNLHRYDEAIDHYKEALRLQPDYSLARDRLNNLLNLMHPLKKDIIVKE